MTEPGNRQTQINPYIGRTIGFAIVPQSQIFTAAITVAAGCVFLALGFPPQILFLSTLWPFATLWLLTGDKPYLFYEGFYRQRVYAVLRLKEETSRATGLPEIPNLKRQIRVPEVVDGRMKTLQRTVAETRLDLVAYVQFPAETVGVGQTSDLETVGARLLRDHRKQYFLTFSWLLEGIPASVSEANADRYLDDIGSLLKQLATDEHLSVNYSCFSNLRETQQQQEYQAAVSRHNPILQVLDLSRLQRKQSLSQNKTYKRRDILLEIQLPLGESHSVRADLLGSVFKQLDRLLRIVAGQAESDTYYRLLGLLQSGHRRYFNWCNEIQKLPFQAHPLTAEQLADNDYADHHALSREGNVPSLIVCDREVKAFRHMPVRNGLHARSVIIHPERGVAAFPQVHRRYLYLPALGKYVGLLDLGKVGAGQRFNGARKHLLSLWNVQDLPFMYDYKLVTHVSSSSDARARFELERLTRNSMHKGDRASQERTVDVHSDKRLGYSLDARNAMEDGATLIVATQVLILYRDDLNQLNDDLVSAAQMLARYQNAARIDSYVLDYYLSTLPTTACASLTKPFDRRQEYMTNDDRPGAEFNGLVPLIKNSNTSHDATGLLMLTAKGGEPYQLDILQQPAHIGIFATTRGGKSILIGSLFEEMLLNGVPIVAMDFPKPTDGSSTFRDFTEMVQTFGVKAAYYDTRRVGNNILKLPDLRQFEATIARLEARLETASAGELPSINRQLEQANEGYNNRLRAVESAQLQSLAIIVNEQGECASIVRNTLGNMLRDFHDDEAIRTRYRDAIEGGICSTAHQAIPTLHDFTAFAGSWIANYREGDSHLDTPEIQAAMARILHQLTAVLKGPLAHSIASPGEIPTDLNFLCFAVRSVDDPTEVALTAVSAYSALLLKALESPRSCFCVDEGAIFFRHQAISNLLGEISANGLKWGARVVLGAQTAEDVKRSPAADKILKNMQYKLVGFITNEAKPSFEEFGFPEHLLDKYSDNTTKPCHKTICSKWLVSNHGQITEAKLYPSLTLLALCANNPDEQELRDFYFDRYPGEPLVALKYFRERYIHCLQHQLPLTPPVTELETTALEPKREEYSYAS
ncbi:MAG: hypothetical protein AAGM36_13845 [Cyanobacteria bacterium J06597_1]